MGFNGFLLGFPGLHWVLLGFYWVFTGFLRGFAKFLWNPKRLRGVRVRLQATWVLNEKQEIERRFDGRWVRGREWGGVGGGAVDCAERLAIGRSPARRRPMRTRRRTRVTPSGRPPHPTPPPPPPNTPFPPIHLDNLALVGISVLAALNTSGGANRKFSIDDYWVSFYLVSLFPSISVEAL